MNLGKALIPPRQAIREGTIYLPGANKRSRRSITIRYYDYRTDIMSGIEFEPNSYDLMYIDERKFVVIPSSQGALRCPNDTSAASPSTTRRMNGFKKFLRTMYGEVPNQVMYGIVVETKYGRGIEFTLEKMPEQELVH